jgi:hypothetical protein
LIAQNLERVLLERQDKLASDAGYNVNYTIEVSMAMVLMAS